MRVLIADDDALSRRLLERMLQKWGYEVAAVADGADAWAALEREDGPKLAILDWTTPHLAGPEICRRVRESTRGRYVYCLLLTAKDRREDLLAGLDAGADDFLIKPFDTFELRARLRAAQRVLDLEEALRVQATHDALTGVLNRGAVLELLERELHRALRNRRPTAVVLADLDHFKIVNDTYGHLAGDAVLREAARRMGAAVRAYDGVGRYGGEEFLFVLPGCTASSAVALAERVCARVASQPVATAQGEILVTLSLGVAACAGAEGVAEEDAFLPPACGTDELLGAADAALYAAKAAGRNRVAMADDRAADQLGEPRRATPASEAGSAAACEGSSEASPSLARARTGA